MLTRLTLRRFRGFTALEVELGLVTAIVGPNSSGKTSVLHGVRMVHAALEAAMEAPEEQPTMPDDAVRVCSNMVLPDPSRLVALSNWHELFTDGQVSERDSSRVELEFEASDSVQSCELELGYGRNNQLKVSASVSSSAIRSAVADRPPKSKHRIATIRAMLPEVTPHVVFVPAFYGVTRVEEYRTSTVVDRLLGGGDQSHIVRNLLARLDSGQLERLNVFLGRTIGARVVYRSSASDAEGLAELAVRYRDTNGELELSSAGAGLVGLIGLFAAFERARASRRRDRPAIFLLDEPEAHLHPRLQGLVGEELAKLAAEFDVQLLMATHSVELINRVGRRSDAVLLSVDRRTSAGVRLRTEPELFSALDSFCDLTPFTSLSFLASRRVLFHEGPTDFEVLSACAAVYFRSDDRRLARFRDYTPVSLEGSGNAPAKAVLAAVLSPKLFEKLDAGAPVRAAIALDRDFTRQPTLHGPTKTRPHFESLEVIWSRHSIESLFLDASCLVEWIAAALGAGTDRVKLAGAVAAALAAADADDDLLDAAIDGRTGFHRRAQADGKTITVDAAAKRARTEVRSEPGTWQPGKRRAAQVLKHVRAHFTGNLRGNLVEIIQAAPLDGLGDPTVLVPPEIRSFLDRLVQE